jgi:hypothetical protein
LNPKRWLSFREVLTIGENGIGHTRKSWFKTRQSFMPFDSINTYCYNGVINKDILLLGDTTVSLVEKLSNSNNEEIKKTYYLITADYIPKLKKSNQYFYEITGSNNIKIFTIEDNFIAEAYEYFTYAFMSQRTEFCENNSFTVNVANSGATEGTAVLWTQQYVNLHIINYDEHIFQMPSNAGSIYTYDWTDPQNPIGDRRAFSIYDRKQDVLATLSVPSENKGTWWVKDQFAAGGTSSVAPAIRILHGTGPPSASAPNGSIFLRTDGDASTTIYVRAGGSWKPMASWEP